MRTILIWPTQTEDVGIMIQKLADAGQKIVYFVGEEPVRHLTPSGAIFHDHYKAWDAEPAEALSDLAFDPPSAEVLHRMHALESLILTMMNKRYDKAVVDERKHVYYTMLGYWRAIFEKLKPEAVVFGILPHSLYSNIIYELAKERGLPVVCFEETWVAGRLMVHDDFWKGNERLRAAFRKAREIGVKEEDLHPELRDYFRKQRNPKEDGTPWYMKEQKGIGAGVGLWRHRAEIALRSPLRAVPRALGLLARSILPNLRSEYSSVQEQPDLGAHYVYFPLNFQPERTTSPQGGVFVDQILAIETLSAALPEGWEIYVKEHPSQWWRRGKTRYTSSRYPGYYRRIARIPHVRVVPIGTSTFGLLAGARAVATITGTAGWEAVLRGKPTLAFGIPWYRDFPSVSLVRNAEDCRVALADITKGIGMPEEADILAFLKALELSCARAHIGSLGKTASPSIPLEESMGAMAEAALARLKERQ